MKVIKESLTAAASAATVLKKGGVVIFPTDTIYGFLADASNKNAVDNIYKLKKRPKSKPLSLFVANIKMAKEIAEIDERRTKLLKKYWPGKVTVVLKRKSGLKLYGLKKDSVAIRIPSHKLLLNLLKKVNRPLVQTSVNLASQDPLNSLEPITATFGKSRLVDLIIDGGSLKSAKPSRIVDLTGEKKVILRK